MNHKVLLLLATLLGARSTTVLSRDLDGGGGSDGSSEADGKASATDTDSAAFFGTGGDDGSGSAASGGGGHRESGSAGGAGIPETPDGGAPAADAGGLSVDAEAADGGLTESGVGTDAEAAYDALWDPVAVGCTVPPSECHPNQGGGQTPGGKVAVGCCRNYCQAGGDWGEGAGCERLVKCADDPTYPNCINGSASCGEGGKCGGWDRYPNPETCILDKPGYNDGFCAYCQVLPGTCGGTSQIVGDCAEGASVPPACTARAAYPGTWCCP